VADAEDVAELFEESRRRGLGQFTEVDAEKPIVEEGQRCASLRERRQWIALGVDDMFEEMRYLGKAHLAGMAFVVKQNQPARPLGMAFTRAVLAKAVMGDLADEVEQARGLGRGRGGKRLTGHGLLPR
jgi:hypothetical protein